MAPRKNHKPTSGNRSRAATLASTNLRTCTSSVCSLASRDSQTLIRNYFVAATPSSRRRSHSERRPLSLSPDASAHIISTSLNTLNQPSVSQSPSASLASTTTRKGDVLPECESNDGTGHEVRNTLDGNHASQENSLCATDAREGSTSSPLHTSAILPKKRRTTPAVYQQLYIDLGQRNFAQPTICSICGMLVVHGLQADIQRHEAVCREHTRGVSFAQFLHGSAAPSLRVRATIALPYVTSKPTPPNAPGRSIRNGKLKRQQDSPSREAIIIEVRYPYCALIQRLA
jgi:zinc-finger of acetyl-transferase ESCO